MELILFVSGIGILALLATHMIDYALESTRRSLDRPRGDVRNQEAASGDIPTPPEGVKEYDQAA
jgi:hypothetical protein